MAEKHPTEAEKRAEAEKRKAEADKLRADAAKHEAEGRKEQAAKLRTDAAKHEAESAQSAPGELPLTQPPMLLEQDPSGLWMYSRPAWVGGPEVIKNGCPPSITTEEAAMTVVNNLYPGSFPEEEPPPGRATEKK